MEGSSGVDRFTAILELDDDGWVGRVREVTEVRVTGACLSEVRRRLQATLTGRFGAEVAIHEQIRVDTDVRTRVEAVHGARDQYEQAREDLRRRMVRTAALLRERGLSSRDVGTLLGVSQQRVSQLWQQADQLLRESELAAAE